MDDLPTGLWVEAQCAKLNQAAIGYYITKRGNYGSGLVLLKLMDGQGSCKLLQQQRNLDFKLEWVSVFEADLTPEEIADEHVQKAAQIDPDLWVVEVEKSDLVNPFTD